MNSALNLNGGYSQIPTGSYLNTPQLSITVWVLPQNVTLNFPRVLEFSNGCQNNSLSLMLARSSTPWCPKVEMYTMNGTYQYQLLSSLNITSGLWQHMAVTFDGSKMRFYLNAILLQSVAISYVMPTDVKTTNFIGGTTCGSTVYSSSYIDDVRLYSKSLNQSQINDIMMSTETNYNSSMCGTSTSTITITSTSKDNYIVKINYKNETNVVSFLFF